MVITKDEDGMKLLEENLPEKVTKHRMTTLEDAMGEGPMLQVSYPMSMRRQCCEMGAGLKNHPGVKAMQFDVPDKKKTAFVQTESETSADSTPEPITMQA